MADLPRICLIYTGGTIGMRRLADGTLCPPQDPTSLLAIEPALSRYCALDVVPLMNKDSSNLTPDDWVTIAQAIHARGSAGYDGFVVAHGTDTMHYTASAVALALGRPPLPWPVVFTGSQLIPAEPNSDAPGNLLRACRVACADLAEVVIVFDRHILRGCRARKCHPSRLDGFDSPALAPLGTVTDSIELAPHRVPRQRETGQAERPIHAAFAPRVLQVSLTPGLEPELLERVFAVPGACDGLIVQGFGAGNVPCEGPFDLIPLIRKATGRGVPVLLTSPFPAASTWDSSYQTGRRAVEAGAIPTGNMTAACSAVKFRWVLAQAGREADADGSGFIDRVRSMMDTVYVGEMDLR